MTMLNIGDLRKEGLYLPSANILDEFASILTPLYDVSELLLKTNEKLNTERNILLPRLMSGMIDIDEIKYNYPKETLA